jgi:oligogalacturonide transport system ATP-binding protein
LHRTLRESGQAATSIYVTHDQVEAMTMGERICVLKEGRIQQVDTPTALYDRPANAFVASFIGSPEMNLIKARLTQEQGQFKVNVGSSSLTLPGSHEARLKGQTDGEVLFGIRPEHIHFHARAQGDTQEITTSFRFMEHMGSEIFLYVSIGEVPLTVRLPADEAHRISQMTRGDSLNLHVQMSVCHLFDAKTELSLLQ